MLTKSLQAVILLAILLSACNPTAETVPQHRIIYGLTFQPSGFDPHIHASSELGIPLRSVYDTLVYRDPASGAFVPGLASSWTISPDGLIYTFTLRQGVKFHDGTPFNAQAVAANLDRITNIDNASQKAIFMLGTYTGYEIIDDYTIRLTLSAPYSPLLDSLSQVYLGIASPSALSAYDKERYQFHQVGTGPFTFVEYVPGNRLVIRRNREYNWGPSFYTAPTAESVDEVEFRFYVDTAARAIALESGDAQIMGELLPVDARALAVNQDIELHPVAVPGQPLQFLMNTQAFPTDDVSVRRGLITAVNREAIIDAVFQRFSPLAWSPLAASTQFYNEKIGGMYNYDPNQARSLLQSTGFTDSDNNGYLDFGGSELSLRIIAPTWGLIPEVAQLLQDQMREVGIRVQLETVPTRGALIEKVNEGNYNLVAYYDFGVDPSFLNRYFASSGANNWTHVSSADLDRVLSDAATATDLALRATLYAEAQRLIMDQALILPIRDYVNLNGARTTIHNLAFDAYGWFPILNNVTVSAG
jgi:peptide/nickel transport system substrate-binding protein